MARILYGVSPIGLGHATRALVVAGSLASAGNDVRIFSGGKAADFLRSEGLEVEDIVSDPAPAVVRGEMTGASLWYIRSWFGLRSTTKRTKRLFDSYRPDMVVCDEEFSGLRVAMDAGCKNAFISDELELGFAHGWLSRRIEKRVEGWYRRLQDSVDVLIIPEHGEDSGNRRYVDPIVREATKTRSEVLKEYSLPSEGRMVLLSLSGSGLGSFLVEEVVAALRGGGLPGTYLAITGNRGHRVTGDRVYDLGLVAENQNLIAAADLVVSTAGKSTIDESASAGTPIIAIPIKHHSEQERNAAALGYSAEDLKNLQNLIAQKIGKREPPLDFRGGQKTSRLLISLL